MSHIAAWLQASRAAHAAELLGVLHSLWDATDVPAEERAHFVRLMSGSLRLHGRSLEKVQHWQDDYMQPALWFERQDMHGRFASAAILS